MSLFLSVWDECMYVYVVRRTWGMVCMCYVCVCVSCTYLPTCFLFSLFFSPLFGGIATDMGHVCSRTRRCSIGDIRMGVEEPDEAKWKGVRWERGREGGTYLPSWIDGCVFPTNYTYSICTYRTLPCDALLYRPWDKWFFICVSVSPVLSYTDWSALDTKIPTDLLILTEYVYVTYSSFYYFFVGVINILQGKKVSYIVYVCVSRLALSTLWYVMVLYCIVFHSPTFLTNVG